ncbi:heme-binding protein [Prosthecobacter sp.]|uniref:SOUL family heme-binding protein n=1 Tax=Prosthecobacter sp. TaxID=1965333 RepID=UPI001DB945B0|nr:heme-binding protein [Prosthecobacter sp.]MCB1277760.1 heme-binding protein [Prosthecobacter sp.]
MKKWFIWALVTIGAALGIAACVTSRSGYETAPYKLIRTDGDFEIREYPELKIATTSRDADNSSFMRLFRYIDGGNVKKEKIAMTTPVFMVDGKMAFVVPEMHKENAPAPASDQVSVDTMKAQRVAAYRYSGSRSAKSEPQALEKLRAWMAQNKLTANGQPFSAYYDPPWTPGFLRRNEVLAPVTH